jgi:hypothetical protein
MQLKHISIIFYQTILKRKGHQSARSPDAAAGIYLTRKIGKKSRKENAMIAIERMTQKVFPGKWAELEKIDKKYDVVEKRLGFPPKKRYQCMIGCHDTNTIIIERQWESLAVMEATYEKAFADPELQALGVEIASIVKHSRVDVYTPLP